MFRQNPWFVWKHSIPFMEVYRKADWLNPSLKPNLNIIFHCTISIQHPQMLCKFIFQVLYIFRDHSFHSPAVPWRYFFHIKVSIYCSGGEIRRIPLLRGVQISCFLLMMNLYYGAPGGKHIYKVHWKTITITWSFSHLQWYKPWFYKS